MQGQGVLFLFFLYPNHLKKHIGELLLHAGYL